MTSDVHATFHPMLRRAATIAVLLALVLGTGQVGRGAASAAPQASGRAPRLVVFLVLDQFRGDYVQAYGAQWTRGLRRLLEAGAVFTNARYPYAATKTCAGHATISTGTFPVRSGMAGNDWYDRDLKRSVACFEDPAANAVTFGGARGTEHYSARSLKVATFADELTRQASRLPQVVAVAQKPRSAVSLGGVPGPGKTVVWQEANGTFSTSTAYAAQPAADIDAYVTGHPIAAAFGDLWTRLRPAAHYRHSDDGVGEARYGPWDRQFPHTVFSPSGTADAVYQGAWLKSPLSDAYMTDLAMHLLRTRRLGQSSGTDLLTLSLPALDQSGHEFGPRSHEVQDVLMRADELIGRLLDTLDQSVGPDNYVLAFTSDHGVSSMPEYLKGQRQDAGRITTVSAVTTTLLNSWFGEGLRVGFTDGVNLSLTSDTMALLRARAGGEAELVGALRRIPGVAQVYRAAEATASEPTSDPLLRAVRLSYFPGRSGDFVLVPRPNWIFRGTSGVDHGTPYEYDQHVPLVLYGARVRKGLYATSASPADIAPTFATLTGITMPSAQGRALTEALR